MKTCNQVILRDISIFFSSENVEHNTAIRKPRHINEFNTSPQKITEKSDQNDNYTFQLKI